MPEIKNCVVLYTFLKLICIPVLTILKMAT